MLLSVRFNRPWECDRRLAPCCIRLPWLSPRAALGQKALEHTWGKSHMRTPPPFMGPGLHTASQLNSFTVFARRQYRKYSCLTRGAGKPFAQVAPSGGHVPPQASSFVVLSVWGRMAESNPGSKSLGRPCTRRIPKLNTQTERSFRGPPFWSAVEEQESASTLETKMFRAISLGDSKFPL